MYNDVMTVFGLGWVGIQYQLNQKGYFYNSWCGIMISTTVVSVAMETIGGRTDEFIQSHFSCYIGEYNINMFPMFSYSLYSLFCS